LVLEVTLGGKKSKSRRQTDSKVKPVQEEKKVMPRFTSVPFANRGDPTGKGEFPIETFSSPKFVEEKVSKPAQWGRNIFPRRHQKVRVGMDTCPTVLS